MAAAAHCRCFSADSVVSFVNPEQKKDDGLPAGGGDTPADELRPDPATGSEPRSPTDMPALRARLDRERRRAVRAESRLAEVELALRRAINAGNGDGVPVGELRAVLDSVDMRLAALEDEIKAGESELTFLEEAQRMGRSALANSGEDIKSAVEEARRDLSEAIRRERGGLPELARQRMEFEVEMDRLQSLLSYRDNVCEGLAEELQNGTRVTADVIGKLADLSRGRVASVRRPPTVDARVAALRRDLEAEQARLQQTRRALEAARAEANAARQAASEAEKSATEQLNAVGRERLEREREHTRLYAELEQSLAQARAAEAEGRRKVQAEAAERHAAQIRLEALASEHAGLREQLALGAGEREKALRARLDVCEARFEETESERVRLAERLSLLQAALAAKEAAEKRREAGAPVVDLRAKRRVLSLVHNRPPAAPGDAPGAESEGDEPAAPPAETLHEREKEIDRLSQRWRELQEAYKGALSEFEDMRRKRDNLLLRMNPPSGPAPPSDVSPPPDAGLPPAPPLLPPAPPVLPRGSEARPLCLVQLDEEGERSDAIRLLARDESGIAYAWGRDPEVPPRVQPVLVVNLMAEDFDPLARIASLAGAARAIDSFTYCARGAHGFIVGPVEYFPAPFEPEICAQRLLLRPRASRRVLAVGEAIETLSSLREILGRARCSTAVAFDGSQALELAPLVRPDFVLVDLSLPAGDALRVLRALRAGPRGREISFGAMWSRPVGADKLRHDLEVAVAESLLTPEEVRSAVRAWLSGLTGGESPQR